jgi:hypothetical protein
MLGGENMERSIYTISTVQILYQNMHAQIDDGVNKCSAEG